MPVSAYARLRMFWGALDFEEQVLQSPGYTSTQIVSGGTSAAIASGIGVRRASILIDRTAADSSADPAYIHFDFLNMTGGNPDDTWITSDYTTLETAITTLMTALAARMSTSYKTTQISWYRVGSGVAPPNPAERVLILTTPIVGSLASGQLPPQVACSITFRTGVRKSWGRTYLPWSDTVTTTGRLTSGIVDSVATAVNTMVTAAAAADFHLVVVSKPLNSSLNVEHVEVDNVLDVIRRRRWKNTTYRKILP